MEIAGVEFPEGVTGDYETGAVGDDVRIRLRRSGAASTLRSGDIRIRTTAPSAATIVVPLVVAPSVA